MPSTRPLSRRVAFAGLLVVGTAACGDDDGADARSDNAVEASSGSGSGSGVAPEEQRASDADVATGLAELVALVDGIAEQIDTDPEAAAAHLDEIEQLWQPIEGTILANDQVTYVTFEDNFAVLGNAVEDGDTDLADQANTAIAEAADAYLAEYPG